MIFVAEITGNCPDQVKGKRMLVNFNKLNGVIDWDSEKGEIMIDGDKGGLILKADFNELVEKLKLHQEKTSQR